MYARSSATFVSHVVWLLAAERHCAAYRLVWQTISDRRLSSKNLENISRGSLLVGTCGPTGAVKGSTATGEGIMLQPRLMYMHYHLFIFKMCK